MLVNVFQALQKTCTVRCSADFPVIKLFAANLDDLVCLFLREREREFVCEYAYYLSGHAVKFDPLEVLVRS